MDRATIVETTYKALIKLNRLLEGHDLVTSRARQREERRLRQEWRTIRKGDRVSSRWLVGESSIYTSKNRGFPIKPFAFRPFGLIRETNAGLRDFLRDSTDGGAKRSWRPIL